MSVTLKYQYLGFIFILHTFIIGLVFYLFRDQMWIFIISEIFVILSLWLSFNIYKKFLKPLELMESGIAAIKDGDFNVSFLETESADINQLIHVFNTMMEKLRSERIRTQEQAYFLESIINASPSGMILLDYDGYITEANPASREILGIKSLEEKTQFENISHPLISHIKEIKTGSKGKIVQLDPTKRFKCQVSSVIHRGFDRRFIIIQELSEELLQSEKAAYGKVIRMMAHEVNNSMGAVNSILQSVIDFGFDDEKDEEFKESLIIASDRNSELAKFMKNFADVIRVPMPVLERIDIKLIADRVKLIMNPIAKDKNIVLTVISEEDESVWVRCDAGLIQQVLINAVKNSIESIEDNGKVIIQINNQQPQISIIDNGPGISAKVKEKLFTPFFSTKPTGQGIGLIISREILQLHNAGYILYTGGDGLTRFEISF